LRNTRLASALFDDRDNFMQFIDRDSAQEMVKRGKARSYQPTKSWRCTGQNRRGSSSPMAAVALLPPPPPPSDSFDTPTTVTWSDMLANVGLSVRPGGYISSARLQAAHDKIAEFRVPSWVNLICVMGRERLENLPAFASPLADIDHRLARELACDDVSQAFAT
jgi:hypothetical protein